MSKLRRSLLAMLALSVAAVACAPAASADPREAFIELTVGDLTDIEVFEDSQFSLTGDLYYNRVDGLLAYFGAEYSSETSLHPRIRAVLGWPSAHGNSYYNIDIEQPLFEQDSFSFGVSIYDKNSWSLDDEEIIGDFGNNMHAFFARIDQRDYYMEEGVTVFAQHKLTPELTFRGEYRTAHLDSLSEQESVWTVFNREDEWRENPPIMIGALGGARPYDGGRMASLVWSAAYDSRDQESSTGWWMRGIAEYSGRSADSDYEYRKHRLEGELLFPLTTTQSMSLYGLWGIGDGSEFPSHKLFHLGGRGCLRGYDYKEFAGKDITFGRAEYKVQMTKPLTMIFFLESGDVGYSSSTPHTDGTDGYMHDAGIGFLVDAPWDGWMRLDVARAMEEDSDINVYLSLLLTH